MQGSRPVDPRISTAIQKRQLLSFIYDNEARLVEPHCYGIDNDGDESLRAWQRSKGWRLFHTAKMVGLVQGTEAFDGPRPGYRRGDRAMQHIYSEL